jgi:RNA polymerase sigma-70 factor (ECF subfamily)
MGETEQKQIFDHWLKEHKGLFFKFVRAYAFTQNDRDDLFQEIAVQVWRSIPNFKGDAAVTTWIYRITINTAIAWSRKEKKHQEGRQSLIESEHLLKDANQPDSRLDWLYEQISQLNEVDRTLTLLLLDGFSYKEMSKIIGISESNVGVKINRIKKVLITKSQKNHSHHGI